MENKIIQYVHYQFRFDKREDIEDLKTEIIANLIDRYNENLSRGISSKEAYVDAIKSMGDFSNNEANYIPEEYSVKPSIPDILLMSGAILSVFGLIITMLSTVIGALVTALSILLFSGAAYYLYSYSQYVRKEHMDIEKHNLLLGKIYKYMKTSFIFWSISLSLVMASLVMGLFTHFMFIDPIKFTTENVGTYITIYMILFIIALILFLLVFKNIYNRLMQHYYMLTGTTNLKGKIHDSYAFLFGNDPITDKKSILLSKYFLPILGVVLILPNLFVYLRFNAGGLTYSSVYINTLLRIPFSSNWEIIVAPLVTLIFNIVLIIRAFKEKLKKQWLLILGYYLWIISTGAITYLLVDITYWTNITSINGNLSEYSLLAIFVLTIIVIYRRMIQTRINRKTKEAL